MESEFITFDKVREEAKWLLNFFKEYSMLTKPIPAIYVHCDSQQLEGYIALW
jgi:hypothetical protein